MHLPAGSPQETGWRQEIPMRASLSESVTGAKSIYKILIIPPERTKGGNNKRLFFTIPVP